MKSRCEAIVLHHVRYGDSGLILKCIIPEGRKSFFIRSFQGKKGAKYPFLLQPLSYVEIEFSSKSKDDRLPLLNHCNLMQTNIRSGSDIVRQCVSLFIAEVMIRFSSDDLSDDELFPLVKRFSELNENLPRIPNLFTVAFLVNLGLVFGIIPEFSISAKLSDTDPEILLKNFENKHSLAPADEIALFNIIASTPITHYEKLHLKNNLHRQLTESTISYIFRHHPSSGEIRSLDVLRQVFGINQ